MQARAYQEQIGAAPLWDVSTAVLAAVSTTLLAHYSDEAVVSRLQSVRDFVDSEEGEAAEIGECDFSAFLLPIPAVPDSHGIRDGEKSTASRRYKPQGKRTLTLRDIEKTKQAYAMRQDQGKPWKVIAAYLGLTPASAKLRVKRWALKNDRAWPVPIK